MMADPLATERPDIGDDYAKVSADRAGAAALERMRQRVQALPPGGEDGPPVTPQPGDQQPVAGTATTIMRNVAEIPRQAIGGVRDAAQAALNGLDDFATWVVKTTGLGDAENALRSMAGLPEADLEQRIVELPEVDEAKTITGSLVRSTTQFLTGFIPLMRTARVAGMGAAAGAATAGVATDFTVFEGQEGNLANLWQELDLPKNVLTDYLSVDEDDPEVEARFKNALSGAGVGLMAEGVFRAARLIRAAKRGGGEAGEQAAGEFVPEIEDTAFGAVNAPLTSKVSKAQRASETGVPDDVTARGTLLGEAGDEEVYVNFSRIDTADDVKKVIRNTANAFKGDIDEARRGVISQEETQALADQLGMTVDDLMARRQGQPFNAEEAVAARRLWAASAENLTALASKAAQPTASAVDQFNFRRALATHYAIQAEVIGARTETARALASWRIPVGSGAEKARLVEQMLDGAGGAAFTQEMARRLAILHQSGANAAAINRYARGAFIAKTGEALREIWVNGLLSNPATHIVNVTSNLGVAAMQTFERGVAARIGGGEGVVSGEAGAMAYGAIMGLKDAFLFAKKAFDAEQSGFGMNKIDLPPDPKMSAEAFDISGTTLGRVVDVVGNAFRLLGGRPLLAEDEFFKTIGYRMELHAQALRQATQEGMTGRDLALRMKELVDNPPEHIRMAAADAALYQTFTNETAKAGQQIGKGVLNFRNNVPASVIVLPFVRTPVNIARFAFERTPLAPLVKQWRDDFAAGGARRDIALARMSVGTTAMLLAMDYADTGIVTGGMINIEQGEREALLRQGIQPYSIKVGDKWVSYNRMDPLGMTLGFAADITEAVRIGDVDADAVDEWQEVAAMAIATISQVSLSKTYLSGLSETVAAASDPERYAPGYIERLTASAVPFTAAMGAAARATDPVRREVNNPADAVYARIAGLSDNLPPKRDLWGRPITYSSGLGTAYDAFAPWIARTQEPSEVDREMVRLRMNARRIPKKANFEDIAVNFRDFPEVYDAYTRLAGNDLKHPAWGLGAKDFLDAVVSGEHPVSAAYEIRSDVDKQGFIESTISDYRRLARQEILSDPEFREFQEMFDARRVEEQKKRLPEIVR